MNHQRYLLAVRFCMMLCFCLWVCAVLPPQTAHASGTAGVELSCSEIDRIRFAPYFVCGEQDGTCLDLRSIEKEKAEQLFTSLSEIDDLSFVWLSPESADLEDVGRIQALPSHPIVDYPLELYGKQISTADEVLVFNRIRIGDKGRALRELLPYLTNCGRLEMEDCGLKNSELGALQTDFPDIQIVWRVNFGCYSVLTDETRILASIKGKELTGDQCKVLRYCTKVKYLDLGHNIIQDISFVQYMPDLEVAILAINYWSDASPLASCKKLEYLEIFNTRCTDLSPLAELTNLKHLNICWIKQLKDISPLYKLTGLERLWIGCVNKVPQTQIAEIQERLPDTRINITTDNPTSEGWRKDPRYEQLSEQMGYKWKQPYSLPSGAHQ